MIKSKYIKFCILLIVLVFLKSVSAQTNDTKTAARANRSPVIIIPGLLGSKLVNKNTGKDVWFELSRAKDDDLRLPISPNLSQNKDNLIAKDIIRSVKLVKFLPQTDIYETLLQSLVSNGYKEGDWDNPGASGFENTVYVFGYDWRRDNVENARLLMQKIATLKVKFKRPGLKFNLIGHSMGGLIAQYAAMYGNADLPTGKRKPKPTWKGAADIDKIFLVGTPNEGSVGALNGLLNGFAIFGTNSINLPFFQNLNRLDVFTIPSIYQLLPHEKTLRVYDENLKPLAVDIYNPLTWEKYGWAAYLDKNFAENFNVTEQKNAKPYFRAALLRAKRFNEALDAGVGTKSPVSLYYLGAECKETLDAAVIYRDAKKEVWETLFKANSFTRSGDGVKVSGKELEQLIYAPGDGVVAKRSFLSGTGKSDADLIAGKELSIACDEHNKLTNNAEIQKSLLAVLDAKK